ncbi:MAG: hypothetical protein E4H44_01620 [Candidatus Aminicenantes bacterium]|nr:MAG: hypothetical protein E4H44_01620 [Candidatus Aminicenantes bacterium]
MRIAGAGAGTDAVSDADSATASVSVSGSITVLGSLVPGLLGRWDALASQHPSVAPSARSLVG